MRTIVRIVILLAFFFLKEQAKAEEGQPHLEMRGTVKLAMANENSQRKNLDSAVITIFDTLQKIIQVCESPNSGLYKYKLPLNQKFVMVCSRKNYVPKIININTAAPAGKSKNYLLLFDIYMFEAIKEVDASVLKDPVAYISYYESSDDFFYNQKQTTRINNKLIKKYQKYYRSQNGIDGTSPKPDGFFTMLLSQDFIVIHNAKKENEALGSMYFFPSSASGISETPLTDITTPASDIIFRIQIMAMSKSVSIDDEALKKYGPVYELVSDSLYRYMVGEFRTASDAQIALQEIVKEKFKDAFIVAFKNGEKITVAEALILIRNRGHF